METELFTPKGIEKITVFYKFENNEWFSRFPDERDWDESYDPHENKWPHDKVKEITEAEAFFGLL